MKAARQGFKEGLQYLKTLDYIPKTHIDFFADTTKAHYEAKGCIAKDKNYPQISAKTAKQILSKGFPLISFDRMKVKARPLKAHFKKICATLQKYQKSHNEIDQFLESDQYKTLNLKELISKTLSHDASYLKSLSKKTHLEENTLKFIAISLAKPFFEKIASEVRDKFKDDSWGKNYCPVCGSEPLMAKIRRGVGVRMLECSLCGTEWKFRRVKCPFCNNEEPKSLKFFYYHEESPHRLYVCDKCKRYIKTIDQKKTPHQPKGVDLPVIQDMATLYLDMLAKEKGYTSPWFLKGRKTSGGRT